MDEIIMMRMRVGNGNGSSKMGVVPTAPRVAARANVIVPTIQLQQQRSIIGSTFGCSISETTSLCKQGLSIFDADQ